MTPINITSLESFTFAYIILCSQILHMDFIKRACCLLINGRRYKKLYLINVIHLVEKMFLCRLTNNKWIINNVIGNLVHVIISGNLAMPMFVASYQWTAMRPWFDHWTAATITVSTLTSPSGRSTVLTETLRAKSRCTDNSPSPYWWRPLRATTLACLLMVKRAVGKAIGLFCLLLLSCVSEIVAW